MKRSILALIFVFITTLSAFAQGIPSNSHLTVPWDEFKKLLQLHENEIVLSIETFQKLLAQTGVPEPPEHTLRAGEVVITRDEFNKLVNQMKTPTHPGMIPPANYLITKAVYSGVMQQNNTVFTANFNVHVLTDGIYLKIPVLPQRMALQDVKLNGEQALIVNENGYHNVMLARKGEHLVTVQFSLKSVLDKGPHRLDLAVQQTPITILNLQMPLKDIELEIPQAQQMTTRTQGEFTNVSAVISTGQAINIRWRKRSAITEKIPAKLYSETTHLLAIEDDILRINTDINYNILHSEIEQVRLALSEGINVLRVTGDAVGEWQEIEQEDQRILLVPFTYGKKGRVKVNIQADKSLADSGSYAEFFGIRVLDCVRETGFVGIALNTSAEVTLAENTGLEMVPVQKLPPSLYDKSAKPLLLGFKYLKHPFELNLAITRHEKIAVPVATINSANAVSMFTEDGKVVHRLVYQVRNTAKQFLELKLPENAQVWSVFVGNKPVESSINKHGMLLVPLIRSQSVNNQLNTFPVEVLYCIVQDRFSPCDLQATHLPTADLLVSQLIWSVYLPHDYAYLHFQSTLEKEQMIQGWNLFSGVQRQFDDEAMREYAQTFDPNDRDEGLGQDDQLKKLYKGGRYRSDFKNVPLEENELASQMAAELEFSRRLQELKESPAAPAASTHGSISTGVLPIQIQIPTGGQVYRFAKTIITAEDPLTIDVMYTKLWVLDMLKWLLFVFMALAIYLLRKKVAHLLQLGRQMVEEGVKFYRNNEQTFKNAAMSIFTPFALAGLFIVLLFLSKTLALLVFFLLWLSLVYQFVLFRERKAAAQAAKSD